MIPKKLKDFIKEEWNDNDFDFKYAEGFMRYLKGDSTIDKKPFGTFFQRFNDQVRNFTEEELTFYLLCKDYSLTRGAFFFAYYAETELPSEGWKIHVSLDNWEDFLYCTQFVMPEIARLNLYHKVVSPFKFEEFCDRNKHGMQCGKHLVIYPESLSFLNELSPNVKKFISEPHTIPVMTDKHLGGRVFSRYTGYSDDVVLHPETKQQVYIPRKEGLYKPEWIEEPQSLTEIINS